MTDVVTLVRDQDGEGTRVWEVRRNDGPIGTARTQVRRGGQLLTHLDVPPADAPAALAGLVTVVREQGEESLALDVRTGDPVAEAAMASTEARLEATQMRLDLSLPVSAPARVHLLPMPADEFSEYRDHLVAEYAQEMFDAGAYTDLTTALEASERSTAEELPDGPDTPGNHLWTAYDGDTPVGILWIHVDGQRGFIYDIEVRQEQRRRGYGREVLDAGARAARELGADHLGLNVFGHNDGARALYEQAGYATIERTFRITL